MDALPFGLFAPGPPEDPPVPPQLLLDAVDVLPTVLARLIAAFVNRVLPTWSDTGHTALGLSFERKSPSDPARTVAIGGTEALFKQWQSAWNWALLMTAEPITALPARFSLRVEGTVKWVCGVTAHAPSELSEARAKIVDPQPVDEHLNAKADNPPRRLRSALADWSFGDSDARRQWSTTSGTSDRTDFGKPTHRPRHSASGLSRSRWRSEWRPACGSSHAWRSAGGATGRKPLSCRWRVPRRWTAVTSR